MKQKSLLGEIIHTFKNFFRKKVTVMYPEQKLETAPRYRGMVSLPVDPETGKDICIACGACARICPENVIEITSEVDENKKKKLTEFKIDFTRCMWCGLCTEVCPKLNLMSSNFYEAATTSRQGLVYDRATLNKIGGMLPKKEESEEEETGDDAETRRHGDAAKE